MEVVVVIGMGQVALEGWKQLCRGGSTLSEVPIFCNDKCTPQRLGRERNWRYASRYLFFFLTRNRKRVAIYARNAAQASIVFQII
jgi:hypothetical protein